MLGGGGKEECEVPGGKREWGQEGVCMVWGGGRESVQGVVGGPRGREGVCKVSWGERECVRCRGAKEGVHRVSCMRDNIGIGQ